MQVCRTRKEDKLKANLLIVASTSRGVAIGSSYVGMKHKVLCSKEAFVSFFTCKSRTKKYNRDSIFLEEDMSA